MSSSHALSQGWKDLYIDDYSLFAPVTDQQDEDMAAYMSRADVRKALHVDASQITSWPSPGIGFDYTSEYDACNWGNVPPGTLSMIDFYKDIVPRLEITWVYNGDTDPCVSYEGTRTAGAYSERRFVTTVKALSDLTLFSFVSVASFLLPSYFFPSLTYVK